MPSPLPITSAHNPRFKRAVKLRERRQREKLGRFLIEGVREIRLALRGGIVIEELFTCPTLCDADEARQIVEKCTSGMGILPMSHGLEARATPEPSAAPEPSATPEPCSLKAELQQGAQLFTVSRELMGKLCFGDRAEGLLAVAVTPSRRLDELRLPKRPLVAVLESIEKPGNIGAVLRSADGAGVDAVVLADPATDLFNPHAIRASLGTIFTVPVAAGTSEEVVAWLHGRNLRIFAARVEGATPYTQADFTGPTAIVLGSEAAGLSEAWRRQEIAAISLPMLGAADSLNVSAAAAVMFYEARRQRERQRFPRRLT